MCPRFLYLQYPRGACHVKAFKLLLVGLSVHQSVGGLSEAFIVFYCAKPMGVGIMAEPGYTWLNLAEHGYTWLNLEGGAQNPPE